VCCVFDISFIFTSSIFKQTLPGMKLHKLRNSAPLLFFTVGVLGIGILMGAGWAGKGRSKEEDLILINSIKFRELLSLIHTDYIDQTDTDSLADAALESIVEELDPHSSYLPRKEVFSGNVQLESNFEGIGAEFQFIDDTIWVSGVIKDSPSEKAGLKSGDRILSVNHIMVSGVNISPLELTHLVRGPKGTPVVAGVLRSGNSGILTLQFTRDRIRSKSIDYYAMTGSDQGYIKCTRFTHSTALEVREALMHLLSSGMKSLVLDLRDNSGGYVSSSIKVADEFLSDKQLIVFTSGRNPENNTRTYATSSGLFESGNLVVLINENTASAAEIVAGALQDHDRALIVGRRSFGKGLVQAPVTLTDGSEVRLTISRYFTPSGRCIQKGFQRKKRQAYFKEFETRAKTGEFFHSDSIHVLGKPVFKTDAGRKVFGGGGIIPDVFSAKDSLLFPDKISHYVDKPVLYAFLLKYVNQNRKLLESMKLETYTHEFQLSELNVKQLRQHLTDFGVELPEREYLKLLPALELYIKAGIAKCNWQYDGFYKVLLSEDPELKKANFYAPRAQKTLQNLSSRQSPYSLNKMH
jgi:carboxyl-terminal processing protease